MDREDQRTKQLAEAALAALPDPALPPGLATRVMNARPAPSEDRWSLRALLGDFWPQAIGMTAALLVGVLGGVTAPGLVGTSDTDLTPYILAYDVGANSSYLEETGR